MTSLAPTLLAIFLAGWLFSAATLWLFARWLRAANPSFLRALIVVTAMTTLGILCIVVSIATGEAFGPAGSGIASIVSLVLTVVQVIGAWVLFQRVLGLSFGRAILLWIMQLIANGATAVPLVFFLKAFVVIAYVQPTNSMAPTILGWHRVAVCPHCQGKLIVPGYPPDDPIRAMAENRDEFAICAACRKSSEWKFADSPMHGPSRILVNQMIVPKRWDIVAFRHPREPKNKWIMRLVGLPGEKVYFKDGAIWINDAKIDSPAELAGTEYTAIILEFPTNFGTLENPLLLGPDECCVLGDFPKRSSDSRDWGAMPLENIEGVVSMIYWPPERWRVLR